MRRVAGQQRPDPIGAIARWLQPNHRLLDIPRGWQWKVYYLCAYGSVSLSCVLIVLSISCFCTGIQNSFMYDEVNCADGTSLAAPMANTLVIYYTMMAMKQQGDYFAAFEHIVVSSTVFFFNVFFAVDQLQMGIRWSKKGARTAQSWNVHFAVMDFVMFALLVLINISTLCIVIIYIMLIARSHRLLDIPFGCKWRLYEFVVYGNVFLSFTLLVAGVSCFFTGVQNSFLYDRVNCTDGTSLTAPMCNMVVVFLLVVALKQQQSGWALFTSFVFTVVVAMLNIFFLWESIRMTFYWASVQQRPIVTENWPAHFAWMDGGITALLLLIEFTDLILIGTYVSLVLASRPLS